MEHHECQTRCRRKRGAQTGKRKRWLTLAARPTQPAKCTDRRREMTRKKRATAAAVRNAHLPQAGTPQHKTHLFSCSACRRRSNALMAASSILPAAASPISPTLSSWVPTHVARGDPTRPPPASADGPPRGGGRAGAGRDANGQPARRAGGATPEGAPSGRWGAEWRHGGGGVSGGQEGTSRLPDCTATTPHGRLYLACAAAASVCFGQWERVYAAVVSTCPEYWQGAAGRLPETNCSTDSFRTVEV